MNPIVAHVPRVGGGQSPAEAERNDLRDLLAAVLEALDMPFDPMRDLTAMLRIGAVTGTLRDVLNGSATNGIPWETDYLRKEIARLAARGW
ncbi:hypothetical protein [Streptomyces sp. KR55]|uniref:hypothetical protein n=1 Tax=Streptomyces sp. KR55 TaxID=3457425 RepID=UPI003FD03522